jgi:hypothetical protein
MAPPICHTQNLLLLRVAPIALRKFIIPQENASILKVLPMKRQSISTLKAPERTKLYYSSVKNYIRLKQKNMASGLLATGVDWFEGEIG